ncbi:linoleate 13S-lipoxygenase 2-1, chloroplastic [Coffea arabica]|uniref:Lipoxygenase n=1 Tax=Coffea arabica TaxID=13443 RepID=A0A6P6TGE0_COFAR|nr:linoleate 13S-lipoxygenase 2-1, chloroplastic-like [Coffea arabica]
MLKPHVLHSSQTTRTLLPWKKPFVSGDGNVSFPNFHKPPVLGKAKKNVPVRHAASSIKAIVTDTDKITRVKAVVTVQPTVGGILTHLGLSRGLDDITDMFGKTLLLEFVPAELDPKTGLEKPTVKAYAHKTNLLGETTEYECDFELYHGFGTIGAILVENEHHKEMFLNKIVIDGFDDGPVNFTCNSWVPAKNDTDEKRIFFTSKSYLPSDTPSGLKKYRENELVVVRGDGTGELKKYDRIYDYDVYNDLGDPDSSEDLARPVIGGKENPYPRRCRTGRPRTEKDPLSESRSGDVYVPRDEAFSEVKNLSFSAKTVYSVVHALVPALQGAVQDRDKAFPYFTAIDSLFNEGINIPTHKEGFSLGAVLPRLIKAVTDTGNQLLQFETPTFVDRDKFGWMRDVEFGRQTLAGLNPCSIKLVTEWPLKSKLDPKVYGPAESAITTELIEQEIKGFMTVEEAIEQKKLFIVDYHDLFLPYVEAVRKQEGTTLYASRTLFLLSPDSTLMPLAIELTRPKMGDKPQWREVFRPSWNSTGAWLWKLAKAHVLAHDSGYHQLVSHWLRTHACTEPYIIATNRQLSGLHPIYRLLHPHFRYTMEINALARGFLISANGIIENSFSPGNISIQLSSVVYNQEWRFDHQALPGDLISRGMAVEDPSAPHGLKLAIEDYPFANDGLILWDILKQWVVDYVNHYYRDAKAIQSDDELQAWWTEIRTIGHGDKKDEPWWPVLKTPDDLVGIITTIIWVTSGHHAAVNFGQYDFAGYFPNRPTTARVTMPCEEPSDERWERFLVRPEVELMACFPSQVQATTVMAILDVLSNHSPDEEYLGGQIEPFWAEDPIIKGKYEEFAGRLKQLEGIIDERNADEKLKNRFGAGLVPYTLLKPYSESGVTGQGVPNSISI